MRKESTEGKQPLEGEAFLDPCEDMIDYVSSCADASLHGPMRLYTHWHMLFCSRCRGAYKGMQALHLKLGSLNEKSDPALSEERRADLIAALKEMEEPD